MNLLVAAHDTGAANALAPVVIELCRRPGVAVTVLASGPALPVFARAGLEAHAIARLQDSEALSRVLQRWLRNAGAEGVVLGTGWGETLDKAVLRAADALGIPSCGVVDSWIYFKERYWDATTGGLRLPTRIAVVDDEARRQAEAAGIPPDTVVVTGQPYLEAFAQQMRQPELLEAARRLRHEWLGEEMGFGQRLILFASEAYAEHWGPGSPYYRGYTEVEALEGLVEAVECCERVAARPWTVVVKLHSRQSGTPARLGPRAVRRGLRVVADQAPWPCLLAADAVVGMTSMALIEASIAGAPTISFQPGWRGPHPFAGTPFTLVPTVISQAQLAQWLQRVMSTRAVAQPPALDARLRSLTRGGAASRIADLALELCRSGEPIENTSR